MTPRIPTMEDYADAIGGVLTRQTPQIAGPLVFVFVVTYYREHDPYSVATSFVATSDAAARLEIARREADDLAAFVADGLPDAIEAWRSDLEERGVPAAVVNKLEAPLDIIKRELERAAGNDGHRKVYSVSATVPLVS